MLVSNRPVARRPQRRDTRKNTTEGHQREAQWVSRLAWKSLFRPTQQPPATVAAGILAEVIRNKPDAVLGFATGASPLPTYRILARQGLDMSRIRGFVLDEYVGLPAGHPQGYAAVMAREITGPLRLDPAKVTVPDGAAADPEQSARACGGIG